MLPNTPPKIEDLDNASGLRACHVDHNIDHRALVISVLTRTLIETSDRMDVSNGRTSKYNKTSFNSIDLKSHSCSVICINAIFIDNAR